MLGQSVARRLAAAGARVACCYHVRAPCFDGTAGIGVHPWEALPGLLERQDAVVCAASGGVPVLTAAHARTLAVRPAVVIDLGMPRTCAPEVAAAGATVCDLEALESDDARSSIDLRPALAAADGALAAHAAHYERIVAGLRARAPTEPA
jgi:glutamyl-tRNA reductase